MNRQPFAVVVSGPSRLAFAGSPETVAELLRVHSPSSILPGAWPSVESVGVFGGIRITNPTLDETGRFPVDPFTYYLNR